MKPALSKRLENSQIPVVPEATEKCREDIFMAFSPTLQCQWGKRICKKRRQNLLSQN